VTPKGENLSENYVSSLSGVFYWLTALLGIGVIAGIYQLFVSPMTRELTALVLAWNTLNFVLFLGLFEVLIEKKQIRNYSRLPAYDDVKIYSDRESSESENSSKNHCSEGQLIDLSVNGARIKLDFSETLPDYVNLSSFSNATNSQVTIRCRVRYQNPDSGELRVQFLADTDEEQNSVVAFTLCDSARWESFQKRRTRPVSYFYGVKHVLAVSIKPIFSHIQMKLK
jgi:cellulose synthase (UDP-forming)